MVMVRNANFFLYSQVVHCLFVFEQSWNAFNDSAESLPLEPQVVAYNHLVTADQHLGLAVSEVCYVNF